MAVVYYCPICNKFSKSDDTNDLTSKGFCKNCNQYSKYPITDEDTWLSTKNISLTSNSWETYKNRLRTQYQNQYKAEQEQPKAEQNKKISESIIVTTTDIHVPYEVIGPVYFQVNDKVNGNYSKLESKYSKIIADKSEQLSEGKKSTGELATDVFIALFATTEVMFTDNFDKAFIIAVEELKYRAALLGADAIIGMRQDLDLDTNGWQHFYLQMYGTAVKYIK